MRMQTVLLSGLFHHKRGDTLWCTDDSGEDFYVARELATLVNQDVMLAMYHLPPDPPDPAKWGGGCCTWQEKGVCPAGHHEHPDRLLVFSATGMLIQREPSAWFIRTGQDMTALPLNMLAGHRSRIVAMTIFKPGVGTVSEDLQASVEQMKDLLSRLSELPKVS